MTAAAEFLHLYVYVLFSRRLWRVMLSTEGVLQSTLVVRRVSVSGISAP